jgi:UDP-N-acetylglucosamine diphosphorylase/glucosamine-1-phosphate N-acetyltransferase
VKIFLDDSHCKESLLPFSLTRNVADILVGIGTIRDKWRWLLGDTADVVDSSASKEGCIIIPANIIPNRENYLSILQDCQTGKVFSLLSQYCTINYPWDIFHLNDEVSRNDFELITYNRKSIPLSKENYVIAEKNIFIEEGAKILNSSLNAEGGPIYIGKNTLIMEGSFIRGPFSIGENCIVKMGAKIYGATSVGDHCVIGGEIKNSVIFSNSNKAHDGYLGDSVIGCWCNLGAGTSNSNLKNNASTVSYKMGPDSNSIPAGIKGGLIMGDYSRSAINTSFNTGSIVGVCCNVFETGMPQKNIPNFSWGKALYDFDKAIRDISNWKALKHQVISEEEINRLRIIYQHNK